ncbi:MAG: transglycosylase family protein [Acidimicrobiales bacterium]
MATLVALPVLFFGRGSSLDIDASAASTAMTVAASQEPSTTGVATTASEATASSLLDTVDRQGLLDGGADPSAALDLQQSDASETATSVVVSPRATPTVAASSSTSAGPEQQAASTQQATSATAHEDLEPVAPTSAAPTTAAPTTAAPATAAPTTAAPTTAPPTTAAPTTAAPTTAAPTTAVDETELAAAPEPTTPTTAADPGVPSAEDWAALRQCEAFGSYTIVSSNGLYYGAYQFSVATWNATATAAGRPDLVGVLPSQASPADQDAMALNLWSRRGFAPWPHCGRGLG